MCKRILFVVVGIVLSASGLAQAQAQNQSAAMVVSSTGLTSGFDQAMHDRLVSLGYEVTVVTTGDIGVTFTIAVADTYDLLLISESIGSSGADGLRGTTAPVMHNESYGWDNWSFTSGANMHWATGTSVDIVNSAHPIAAMAGLQVGPMEFFSRSASWTTDSVIAVAPGAKIIAQITDAGTTCAIVFVIDEGAQLVNGNPAPARIGAFSIPGDNSYAASVMTDKAWALFDATVRWLTRSVDSTTAKNPSPADTETDIPTDVVLSWEPGEFAKTHDVYFGTGFEDVNTASRQSPTGVLASQGQEGTTYEPAVLLEFGTTYYWRVDEVNAPPSGTIFKGNVWSFTVEPYSRKIAADRITATASSSLNADSGPQKTADGSGLDALDQHNTAGATMWMSAINQQPPVWIQYEFDTVFKLHQMWVWNSNNELESLVGLGVKTATIEYSTDGATWMALANVPEFTQAPGATGYAHNTTVEFGDVAAKFVRITITSNWGGRKQYGLSEVRFFSIPVSARDPNPATGATGVALDTTLSWRTGREAAEHKVYLDADPQAVANGIAPATMVSQTSYSPSLDLGTTYYWRVDEANTAQVVSTWAGPVWNFTTASFLVVDDMESYTDGDDSRIYKTWIDGEGITDNGSQVGHLESPFVERTNVHSGRQSMPLYYDNTSSDYSAADYAYNGDLSEGGATTLLLYFRGDTANDANEPMWVQLTDQGNATGQVVYGSAPGEDIMHIAGTAWQAWSIPLEGFNVDVTRVKTLSIGMGVKDGSPSNRKGIIYIDDVQRGKP